MMGFGMLGLLLFSAPSRTVVVLLDFSLSSRNASGVVCQHDVNFVSQLLADLHAALPTYRVALYLASRLPGKTEVSPGHPRLLLALNPVSWKTSLELRASQSARIRYARAVSQKIRKLLASRWSSLLGCTTCSALKFSIREIVHFRERKVKGFLLLSDGIDESASVDPLKVPVMIGGSPSDRAPESRVEAIWEGWRVKIFRSCDPELLVETFVGFVRPSFFRR